MTGAFISYVRHDKHRVARLVRALRQKGVDVWWDDDIPPDAPWETTIEGALGRAETVIVCWSAASIASDNVRAEARWARNKGRLLQIFLDQCDPPLFFGERQGVDLSHWNGNADDPRFARLLAKLRETLLAADASATAPHPRARQGALRLGKMAAWIAAVALLLLAIGAAWWLPGRLHQAGRGTRVAVLPFEVLSKDSDTALFARALGDQIVGALNSSEMPALSPADAATVRGSASTVRLRELGVSLVFDGTVESMGKNLTVQVHVDDPFQHVTLWTGGGRGSSDQAVALRSQVSRTVVGVLACSNRALKPNGLTDPNLLGRYLRACDLFVNENDASDPKAMFEMLDDLRMVTAQAPGFAAAHSDLAKFDAYLAPITSPDQAAAMRAESARESAKALAIEPRSPDAYLAREMALPPTEWAQREALLRKGVSFDPGWPHTNGFLAQLLEETGHMKEAIEYAAHASAADLQIDWGPASAWLTCAAGDIDDTVADVKRKLETAPGDDRLTSVLIICLLDANRFHEARALEAAVAGPPSGAATGQSLRLAGEKAGETHAKPDLDEARRQALALAGQGTSGQAQAIVWLSQLGFVDDAFRIAERYRPGYPMTEISNFLFGPRTSAMRRDPRFMPLMARYGLLSFWRSTGRWPDFCADPSLPYKCRAVQAH